jgi:hypothetical protein
MSFIFSIFTKDPKIASWANYSNVSRIGVDLEYINKHLRQPSSFRISCHTVDDLYLIKKYIEPSRLFCRINPFHEFSKAEIESVISCGVKYIMLPMFHSIEEIINCLQIINSRAQLIPLIETSKSCKIVSQIKDLDAIKDVHIGLNDLHLDLNLKNFFNIFGHPVFEKLIDDLRHHNMKFGLGGIAQYHDKTLEFPSKSNYEQYLKTGASGAILSRSFLNNIQSKSSFEKQIKISKSFLSK